VIAAICLSAVACDTHGQTAGGNDGIRLDNDSSTPPVTTGSGGSGGSGGSNRSSAAPASSTRTTDGSGTSAGMPAPAEGKIADTKVRVELLSLNQGNGGLVTLKFTVTNIDSKSLYPPMGISYSYLLDIAGQKKYLPVKDSSSQCICDDGLDSHALAAGDTAKAYVTYSPIPENVKAISVYFTGLSPFEDVPVS
jgi:hypothetical protein